MNISSLILRIWSFLLTLVSILMHPFARVKTAEQALKMRNKTKWHPRAYGWLCGVFMEMRNRHHMNRVFRRAWIAARQGDDGIIINGLYPIIVKRLERLGFSVDEPFEDCGYAVFWKIGDDE